MSKRYEAEISKLEEKYKGTEFREHMVAALKKELAEEHARITDEFATEARKLMDGLSIKRRQALVEFLKCEPNPTENVKDVIAKLEESINDGH